MEYSQDIEIIGKISKGNVLVVGDVMLDCFVEGVTNRISPEAPVPVLKIESQKYMLGGAGNVAANLRGIHANVSLIARVGHDQAAQQIETLLGDIGVNSANLIRIDNFVTSLKTRYSSMGQQLLRCDEEDTDLLDGHTSDRVKDVISNTIGDFGCVVLSDYGKGFLTKNLIEFIIGKAKSLGIPVLVDPKSSDYTRYKGADIITPNAKELSEATQSTLKTDDDFEKAAKQIMGQHDIGCVVATRSADGMSVFQGEEEPLHISTIAKEVYDVSGAGDSVVAVIAACVAAKAQIKDAVKLANIAGGIVVGRLGTSVVSNDDLIAHCEMQGDFDFARPDRDEALRQVSAWKAQGLKVGFTNGCFDIIHHGHVSYLARTKEKCDRLVLGLNSDASVSRLKGPTRPINDEEARRSVMAALASIDLVVLFGDEEDDQDMPCNIIGFLKPDIIFKGGDYTVDQLPEAKVALSYGGEVEIMPLYEGYSTTNIVKKASSGS